MSHARTSRPSSEKAPPRRTFSRAADAPAEVWLWGTHAVLAALANPDRIVLELVATRNAARELPTAAKPRLVDPDEIDAALPRGAVHQGLAARVRPLAPVDVSALLAPAHGLLV